MGEETDACKKEDVKLGLEKGSIQKISQMVFHLKGFGGKVYAYIAAVAFHNIAKDD